MYLSTGIFLGLSDGSFWPQLTAKFDMYRAYLPSWSFSPYILYCSPSKWIQSPAWEVVPVQSSLTAPAELLRLSDQSPSSGLLPSVQSVHWASSCPALPHLLWPYSTYSHVRHGLHVMSCDVMSCNAIKLCYESQPKGDVIKQNTKRLLDHRDRVGWYR